MTKRSDAIASALIHAAPQRRMLARRGPAPMALEQRIMFDGAGADAAVRHAEHVVAEAPAVDTARIAAAAVAAPVAAPRTEIVFIEDNVTNVAQLVAGVRAGVEVIMLDHTRDGLQQMLDALAGHAPVDAIHVVSHGATGQLSLGTLSLSVDNVDAESAELAQLGRSLKAGGDLLLYGCDVAQGTAGAGFVERLAVLTGADVAASTDVTGSADFAGNWTLEAHSGTIETAALDLSHAGWDGELVNTVYDAARQALTFNSTTATFISGTNGTATGNITRFNDVITIGGQKIDAVVTTTLDRTTMLEFDSVTNPSTTAAYFQPTMQVNAAGGGVSFKIDFYLGGTYTGAGTGTAVTLQNVVVNSYDIDSYGTGAADRQFQVFQGFDSYTLSANTQLVPKVLADGSVEFVYQTTSPINNGAILNDPYRVEVYYESMSSFTVKSGVEQAATGTFHGQAYFALDFSEGPAWASAVTTVDTPAPNLSYSATTFAESAANDGAITATATITLANGTFSGTDNSALSGVTFSNLPAGLSAQVTRTSATTATLSFSGQALANANANDIHDLGVSFANAAFTTNNAGAVTGATRADLAIDFADPVADTTAPVVTARSDSYTENRSAGALLTTVGALDNVGVTGFRFTQTGTGTSADGYFAIAANGAITLTAAGAAAGAAANDYETAPNTFVMGVQAGDAAGNWSVSQNVTLNVLNVDDVAPLFSSSATASANENQAVLYTAAATDTVDFTNGVVSYALAGGADAALLHIDSASGVVTLASGDLDFETRSAYSFTVRAQDASGNASLRAVTVAVVDLDEIAPTVTIASDKPALKAGDSATLTFTFSEDVGASFTAADIALQSGSIGPLTRVDATHYSAVYTPDAAVAGGLVTVSIAPGRVQDLAGNDNITGASLALAVDTVAPSITGPAGIAIPENTTAVVQFAATEPVTWSIAGGEDAARFTLAPDGTLAFASAPDFEHPQDGATAGANTYLVNLRAVDAAGNATVQALTVTVTDVNEAPAGSATAFHVAEDTRYNGTLPVALDPDGDALTYTLASNGAHGQAVVDADGAFHYQGAPDFHGADSFTYLVADGRGGQAQYTVAVTVDPVNDAPVAANTAIVTSEDTPAHATLPAASDVDGDAVTYAKAADPQHGGVTVNADGAYVYTPAADFHGADSFSYTVSDGQGGANTYTVAVTVLPVNDAPVAANTAIVTSEDTPAHATLPAASDVDGDTVTYAKAAAPQHGSVTINADGAYVYTPAADFHGADSFAYTVSDGQGGANTYTIAVTVLPVNDAPVAANTAIVTSEDTPAHATLPAASDVDGDTVTYAKAADPQHGSVTINADGAYVYTPAADFHGADSFAYTVSDGHGGANTYTVAVTVLTVNDAPVASDAAYATNEDTRLAATLPAASDVDGDSVAYAATTAPQHGTVAVNADGSYVYTPGHDFNGHDSFGYSVDDGHGGVNLYTVVITVRPVNDAPVASGPVDGAGTVGVAIAPVAVAAFTDIDSPVISYSATRADGAALPAWLAFDPATRTFTGTPPAGSAGTLDLVVSGSDGELAASRAVTLTIDDAATPGQAVAISAMNKDTGASARDFITADGSAGRTVTGTLSAPLGANQALRVSFDNGATFATATVAGSTWTVADTQAHAADWTIVAQVTNSVTGSTGPLATQRVVLDAATPAAASVDTIASASTTPVITGTATLAPGETLTVTVDGQRYAVTPHDGTWSLTPATPLAPGHTYDITATVRDSAGNTAVDTATHAVTVEAPVPTVLTEHLDTADRAPAAPATAPAATVATVAVPDATPAAVPVTFSSLAVPAVRSDAGAPGSVASNDTLAPVQTLAPASIADLRQAAELSDVYTRIDGFRTVVAKADNAALLLFQGVPDQFVDAGTSLALTVPSDAFAHTQPTATVSLSATLQDGQPLPSWVSFSSQTGQFTGEPPAGLHGELRIKLTARDMAGREATALFRVNVGQGKAAAGKSALSEQLRQSGSARAGGGRG